ncbi:SDR family NAD(P)-dependent oxidoreductase [Billgrantia endophytica]|uniref:Short-chain dehydrogenase n=1 Tax=Billgrantia endophytica TaxID=2033802 RepID=A0A2N7TUU8_9GAMM|nr:SDR family NAD(P)-dependent oxidoreductase [Halomonas endophytica]PMR71956.1 hypothetical protein C1H69_22480 [Halomonas endophytica]
MSNKTWSITGAARGLGAQIAQAALAAGDNVVATARNVEAARGAFTEHTERLLILPLDMTDPAGPQAVAEAAIERFGTVDVLVNNAGYGQLGIHVTVVEPGYQLANAQTPPLHLLIGSDAVSIARQELTERLSEIAAWESLSTSTDHDDVASNR